MQSYLFRKELLGINSSLSNIKKKAKTKKMNLECTITFKINRIY